MVWILLNCVKLLILILVLKISQVFGNVCNVFPNVGSEEEEMKLFLTFGVIELGWCDLCGSRRFRFWVYVWQKLKNYWWCSLQHDTPHASWIFGELCESLRR